MQTANETGATPYDVPGVEFTHVGDGCSFDTFVSKYRLENDPAIVTIAAIVRRRTGGRMGGPAREAGPAEQSAVQEWLRPEAEAAEKAQLALQLTNAEVQRAIEQRRAREAAKAKSFAPSAMPGVSSEGTIADVSVYAPPRISLRQSFLVQVFVYDTGEDESAISSLAKELDLRAERRGVSTLDIEIKDGDRLDFVLDAPGLKIEEALGRSIEPPEKPPSS